MALLRQLKEDPFANGRAKAEDYVFTSRTAGPLGHRNVAQRGFEAARDRAQLDPRLTFHDLRHAFASRCASRGVPINVLSEVMGHSDIVVTLRVYVAFFGRDRAEAAFRAAMSG